MFARVTFASALSLTMLVGSCDPPPADPPPVTQPCRTPPCPIAPPRDTRVVPTSTIGSIDGPADVSTPASPVVSSTTQAAVLPPAPGPVGVWQHPDPLVERWHQAALAAGWPEADWPRVACIIRRESGGDPTAHNPRDPGLGSYGLAQLNLSLGRSGTWALWGPSLGWDATRLYDGPTNLTYARDLYQRAQRMWGAGWRPWGPGGC